MATLFAITVEFELAAGRRERFLELVRENASTSVRLEPGCQRFDVLVPERSDVVFLYEVYVTLEAFEDHLASDHFRAFDRATKEMVVTKTVAMFEAFQHIRNAE